MKKHSKKIFAALALILALACALTACAPAAASSGNAESRASEAPASSKADEKPVTLKYVNHGAKPDTGNCDGIWKAVNEILLKDLNCTVDVEYLGSGDKAQMALKYAGNEKFDFAFTVSWFGFGENALKNAFYEIKQDELEKYAPYMVKTLSKPAWLACTISGKLYAVPAISTSWSDQTIAIRGDLREKYGMDPLKTTDDLEKYLENVAKNESGVEPCASILYAVYCNQKYGYRTNGEWAFMVEDPEKGFEHLAFLDGYLEMAKKSREYVEKGFFSPDLANDSTTANDKFLNGLSATVFNVSQTTNNRIALPLAKSHPEWKVEMFNATAGTKTVKSVESNAFAITRTSEHPTKVLEVINHINESVELQKLLCFGVEGVDYEMKDGMLVKLSDVPKEKAFNIGTNWNMTNKVLWATFYKQEAYEGYDEILADLEKNSVENILSVFAFDNSAVETEVANISAVQKEFTNGFNYGLFEDVDAKMEEYRQALKDAGYDKVKAEYNRQAKEFLAANQ